MRRSVRSSAERAACRNSRKNVRKGDGSAAVFLCGGTVLEGKLKRTGCWLTCPVCGTLVLAGFP